MKDFVGRLLTRSFFYNPIFIVGASRSGTSVLLQALGQHPAILSMPGEAPFITSIGGAVHLFEFSETKEYYRHTLRYSLDYLYKSLRRLCFEYAAGRNYGLKLMLKGLLSGDVSYLRKKHWCAKTFPDHKVAQAMMKLYPNVRFIHVLRNGCEVVESRTKFSGFREKEFEAQCQAWTQSVTKFSYLRTLGSAFEVRHEQLVLQTDELLENLLQFLNIPYNRRPANYVKRTIVHPLDRHTQHLVDVKRLFEQREPGWKSWTFPQRDLFKRVCAQKMNELGYQIPF
jgi:hypothetical protein